MGRGFKTEIWLWGLVRKISNETCNAGHVGLFSKRGGYGFTFHLWNQSNSNFALERCWRFGLFNLHHTGDGFSGANPGWRITTWQRVKCHGCRRSMWRKPQ